MSLPTGWYEYQESGKEQFNVSIQDGGSFSSTRVFDGPWDDRFWFLYTYIFPTVVWNNNTLIYVPGASYPAFPLAYATDAQVDPIHTIGYPTNTGPSGMIRWQKCRIRVNYRTLDYNQGNGGGGGGGTGGGINWLSEDFTSSATALSIPITPDSNDDDDDEGVFRPSFQQNILIPEINYNVTHHFVIFPDWELIELIIGKVNILPLILPSGQKGANKETILFSGANGNRRVMIDGINTWEITYNFSYNRIGWNKVYNPDTGAFEDAWRKGTNKSQLLYQTADFNSLF